MTIWVYTRWEARGPITTHQVWVEGKERCGEEHCECANAQAAFTSHREWIEAAKKIAQTLQQEGEL